MTCELGSINTVKRKRSKIQEMSLTLKLFIVYLTTIVSYEAQQINHEG